MIENVSFHDVHVTYAGGGTGERAAKRAIPQTTREYFGVWGEKPFGPPAYGLFARNVRGLTLHNVRFETATPDARPAIIFDHVSDVSVNGLAAQADASAESALRFIATKDALVSASRVLTPTAVALRVEGKENSGITIDGGDWSKAAKPIELADGAEATAVKWRV